MSANTQHRNFDIPRLKDAKLKIKRFGKLYKEGQKMDYAYILLAGEVTLCGKNPDGRKVTFHKANVGEVLGIQALQNSGKSTHSALINKSSKFLAIQLPSIHTYVEQIPDFRDSLTHQLINNIDLIESVIRYS